MRKWQWLVLLFALSLFAFAGCDDESSDDNDDNGEELVPGVTCKDNVCTMTGTITENLELTPDKDWLLHGGVEIGNDKDETVLTIQPGTVIYGETSTYGMLVITRGSKIMAEGTKDAPIVFTSSKNEGDRARGDWGGLIINGRAPINGCDEEDGAAFCESFGEGGTGWYGGDSPTDSSGVLRYVRVEFAGHIISPENELNGIAFQGVGSGTTIEYIQVHMNKDDGIEFFGGTAQIKYALVTGAADDGFDWTDGWQGKAQFVVVQQYDDAGDQGIEADNNGEDNGALPRSHPTLSNFTLIGSPDSEDSDLGILLREGTAANISNTIVTDFNDACLDIDNEETFTVAMTGGTPTGDLTITHSIVNCATDFKMDDEKDEDENPVQDPWSLEDFYTDQEGNQVADPKLGNPLDVANPDYAPASGSPAESGASVPDDAFFTDVDFIGAVDPANDWTAGWTIHEKN